MPTYHLANIVDDHLMETSHVMEKNGYHHALSRFIIQSFWLGCPICTPALILKPVGNGKLSKRDGDKLVPVFPLEWKTEEGISSGYRERISRKQLLTS
jgi:glutamyl-tRNA synthetase